VSDGEGGRAGLLAFDEIIGPFVFSEDETGSVNVIVWRQVREHQRPALLRSRLLAVAGQWQAKDGTTHLIARRLVDMTPWLGAVATSSRDFH